MQTKLFTLFTLAGLAGAVAGAPTKKPSAASTSSAESSAKAASAANLEASDAAPPSAPDEVPDQAAKTAETATEGPIPPGVTRVAAVSTIDPESLADFEYYPPQIQTLIRYALDLTKRNLTYTFGSSDPTKGGMDCSGTIFHLLSHAGINSVPRQSDAICDWVRDHTLLHRISQATSLSHAELAALNPGDLLFWSGTYTTAPRKTPVTHVMLYLGKLKTTGRPVVFGASDGRVYEGKRRTGVSVFDFSLPKPGSTAKLYAYGLIPGVGRVRVDADEAPAEVADTSSPESKAEGESPQSKTTGTTLASDSGSSANPEEVRRATPASAAKTSQPNSKSTSSKSSAKNASKKKATPKRK